MNVPLLIFITSLLTAIKSYPKVLANLVPGNASAASAWARLQLFPLHVTNTTKNTIVPCSIELTDQDRVRDLRGLAVFGEVLVIFTIVAIIVGEVLAWRKRRGAGGEDERVGLKVETRRGEGRE